MSTPPSGIVACIPSLRRYARGLMADRARADDLVQDTLERAWVRFASWRQRGDLRAWLFGIMHNQFIDTVRAQQSRAEGPGDDDAPERPQRPMQSDRLELRDLDRVLQRLPASQREVLLLVGVEELSYAEVALVTGVPIGTVMSRLSRARDRLREELRASWSAQPAAAGPLRSVTGSRAPARNSDIEANTDVSTSVETDVATDADVTMAPRIRLVK